MQARGSTIIRTSDIDQALGRARAFVGEDAEITLRSSRIGQPVVVDEVTHEGGHFATRMSPFPFVEWLSAPPARMVARRGSKASKATASFYEPTIVELKSVRFGKGQQATRYLLVIPEGETEELYQERLARRAAAMLRGLESAGVDPIAACALQGYGRLGLNAATLAYRLAISARVMHHGSSRKAARFIRNVKKEAATGQVDQAEFFTSIGLCSLVDEQRPLDVLDGAHAVLTAWSRIAPQAKRTDGWRSAGAK